MPPRGGERDRDRQPGRKRPGQAGPIRRKSCFFCKDKVDERRARHEAKTFEDAQTVAERLGKVELRFDVKAGPTGSLFGSVTPTDIADELWDKHKVRVDRRKIGGDTIKRIGRYQVPIELFQDVTVDVRTLVVPEGGELPPEEELEALEAQEQAVQTQSEEKHEL